MPKQITQAELQAVLDNYKAAFVAALELRRRLEVEEATIEPGRYSLESDGENDPISGFDTDMSSGLKAWGMEIFESKDLVPEWLTETPQDLDYKLEVWDPDTTVQAIGLTRAEYIALKEHVAKMRGIAIPEVAHA